MQTLTKEDLARIDLPKWPAMTVVGEDVTREQAAEIIVRTNIWWHTCNDRNWLRTVWEALGLKLKAPGDNPQDYDFDSLRECVDLLDPVEVEYLNNSRVMSSWVGGAHGWCDWNGRIYSVNYNIGKWPGTMGILSEWCAIAKAFPYLKLRCQLWSGETSEAGNVPVVEYVVCNGEAFACMPEPLWHNGKAVVPSFDMEESLHGYGCAPGLQGWLARERGCDEKTLFAAVRAVQNARVERLVTQTVERMASDLAADITAQMVEELLKPEAPTPRKRKTKVLK